MAKTVLVEVPEELAGAVKRFVEEVEGAMPETRGGRAVDVASYERAVEQSAAGLEQESMRRLLQALDVDAPHVIIHGKPAQGDRVEGRRGGVQAALGRLRRFRLRARLERTITPSPAPYPSGQ